MNWVWVTSKPFGGYISLIFIKFTSFPIYVRWKSTKFVLFLSNLWVFLLNSFVILLRTLYNRIFEHYIFIVPYQNNIRNDILKTEKSEVHLVKDYILIFRAGHRTLHLRNVHLIITLLSSLTYLTKWWVDIYLPWCSLSWHLFRSTPSNFWRLEAQQSFSLPRLVFRVRGTLRLGVYFRDLHNGHLEHVGSTNQSQSSQTITKILHLINIPSRSIVTSHQLIGGGLLGRL